MVAKCIAERPDSHPQPDRPSGAATQSSFLGYLVMWALHPFTAPQEEGGTGRLREREGEHYNILQLFHFIISYCQSPTVPGL